MNDKIIESKLSSLISLLVNRDFGTAGNFLLDKSVGAESIKDAIESYEFGDGINQVKLTMPPADAFAKQSIYPQSIKWAESAKATWILEFELWFNNQPGDLTLICAVKEDHNGNFDILISDIRMM
ncbi:MAG: hypothetical protein RL748_1739 [Pseudomonadota bacterium]|jgi:hypothetical protein